MKEERRGGGGRKEGRERKGEREEEGKEREEGGGRKRQESGRTEGDESNKHTARARSLLYRTRKSLSSCLLEMIMFVTRVTVMIRALLHS